MRLAVAVSALILVTASAGNAWVSGVIIGTVAVVALTKFAEWEEWVTLLLGVWSWYRRGYWDLFSPPRRPGSMSSWV